MKKRSEINPIQGTRLKASLKENRIKQKQLAVLVPCSEQIISNIIQHKKPLTPAMAQIMAPLLNVRPEYLLGDDNIKQNASHNPKLKRKQALVDTMAEFFDCNYEIVQISGRRLKGLYDGIKTPTEGYFWITDLRHETNYLCSYADLVRFSVMLRGVKQGLFDSFVSTTEKLTDEDIELIPEIKKRIEKRERKIQEAIEEFKKADEEQSDSAGIII